MSEQGTPARSPREGGSSDGDPYTRLAKGRLGKVVRRKWRLDTLLGVGGMAAVYAASHRNGTRAAIKMLHPMVATEEARRRFLREGYLANSVGHPGVVHVVDDDEAEDGSMFLVMELLEGESLESYAARRVQIDPASALAIAEQVLEVLAAAHAKGIVHRDVKPENVFLCADGRVKLLDFGVARLHEASRAAAQTHHGFLLGTPTYMAPEQARGDWEIVDGRTDVWSVGASLFRVLTSRTVHRGTTHVELLLAATSTPAPKVRTVSPGVPELVASLVDKALAFDMKDRWSSAQEMLESVRSVHAAMGYPAASKLRVKIASDTTVRVDLPKPPQSSEELDRGAVLAPLGLGALPGDLEEVPTAVAAIDPAQREKLRSLMMDVSVDVDLSDDDEVASPGRSGIQGAGAAGREMASIFDETAESTVAMPHPPQHFGDPATLRDADADGAEDPALAGTLPELEKVAPPKVAPRTEAAADRRLVMWWAIAGIAVAGFLVALAWRLLS